MSKKPWQGSNRKERLPTNWQELRRTVIARAAGRCQAPMRDGTRCSDAGIDVDHVIAGDDHSLDNLQLLCRWHHAKKSAREGSLSRPRYSEKRPQEPHPGLHIE